ncbi:hypothetical protein RSOLAG22IIIB_13988 [Rhizoctonia solani]|uniref:Uncharacterized protein n=1 Tax=Rhizoctonia solani TaxID=456999 RepID=A0A0K6FTF5_9AGAM|nr:hypothetical protein RSOLAG22IIIB_13988 [Rhizoctonia solani]
MKLPQDEPDDVEAMPAPKPSRSKRPAIRRVPNSEEEASDRPQKIVRDQPIEGSENKTNDANKQDRPPTPASDSPPGDEESTIGISGDMREATPSNNPTGGKRKTNAIGKGKGKDKPSPLAERSPTPNPIASGLDVMEETEQPVKQNKRGRKAKQELIDEVDGVVGSPTTAPAKKAKVTRKRTKQT